MPRPYRLRLGGRRLGHLLGGDGAELSAVTPHGLAISHWILPRLFGSAQPYGEILPESRKDCFHRTTINTLPIMTRP